MEQLIRNPVRNGIKWTFWYTTPFNTCTLEKYYKFINWQAIANNPYLDINFIENNLYQFHLISLFCNPSLPEWFLDKYQDLLYHKNPASKLYFGSNVKLSQRLMTESPEICNKITTSSNPYLTLEYIKNNLSEHIDGSLLNNPNIDYSIFVRIMEKELPDNIHKSHYLKHPDHFDLYFGPDNTFAVSNSQTLDTKYLQEHIHLIDFKYFCGITPNAEFLEANLDKLKWSRIAINPNLPISFLEKHLEMLRSNIHYNKSLPRYFIKKHNIEITHSHPELSLLQTQKFNLADSTFTRILYDSDLLERYLKIKIDF